MSATTSVYGDPSNAFAVSEFANSKTFLAPMPTAVVILKSGSADRNKAACEAYLKMTSSAAVAAAGANRPNTILTRWPLALDDIPAAMTSNCDQLVANYDFTRAGQLLGAVQQTGAASALTGRGPFILEILPNGQVVGIDGSQVDTLGLNAWMSGWPSAVKATEAKLAGPAGQSNPTLQECITTSLRDAARDGIVEQIPGAKVVTGALRWLVSDSRPQSCPVA